ncbi:unnamed protein product [Calypogeia fissa]
MGFLVLIVVHELIFWKKTLHGWHFGPTMKSKLREKLALEKTMHMKAAIDQRHAMSDIINFFVKEKNPNQVTVT